MKKIAFCIVLLAMSCLATMADSFEKDGFYYFIEDEIQVTVWSSTTLSGEVTVPANVSYNGKNYIVTKISGIGSNVTKLNLPVTLKEMDEQCFYGTDKLEYINWEKLIGLQTIGARAFTYSGIKQVTIPANVRTIEENAFSGCEELTNLTIQTVLLKEISKGVWDNCTKLTTIDLSATQINKIGENAFYGCTALKTVKLPQILQEIGATAFAGCTAMTEFTIPPMVTTLGDRFLAWNTSLKKLTVQSYNPCAATSKTFEYIDKDQVTLFVPKQTVSLYKNATGWKDFKYITDGTQAIENVTGDTSKLIKSLRDGQIFIFNGDKTYTLTGQEY